MHDAKYATALLAERARRNTVHEASMHALHLPLQPLALVARRQALRLLLASVHLKKNSFAVAFSLSASGQCTFSSGPAQLGWQRESSIAQGSDRCRLCAREITAKQLHYCETSESV